MLVARAGNQCITSPCLFYEVIGDDEARGLAEILRATRLLWCRRSGPCNACEKMSSVCFKEQLLLNYLEICCRCPAHKTAPQATTATTDRVAEKVRDRQNNAEQLQDAVTLPMDGRALRPCEAQKLLL